MMSTLGATAGRQRPVESAPTTYLRSKDRHRNREVTELLTNFVMAMAAVLVGLNVRGWRDRLFTGLPRPQIQALAVLPLTNLSGDLLRKAWPEPGGKQIVWGGSVGVWHGREERRRTEDHQRAEGEISSSLCVPDCVCQCIHGSTRQGSGTHLFGAGLRRARPTTILLEGGTILGSLAF